MVVHDYNYGKPVVPQDMTTVSFDSWHAHTCVHTHVR